MRDSLSPGPLHSLLKQVTDNLAKVGDFLRSMDPDPVEESSCQEQEGQVKGESYENLQQVPGEEGNKDANGGKA